MNSKLKSSFIVTFILGLLLSCRFATNVLYPPAFSTRPPAATATTTGTPLPTPNRTASAEAAATNDDFIALQTAMPDLEELGFSVNSGKIVWYNFSEIDLTSFGGGFYEPLDEDVVVRDFILSVDVTWDSDSGYAGCGIIFHSDKDFQRGQHARFNTIRLSGFPGWDIELVRFGYYYGTLSGTVHLNSAINQGKGSTNHYILVSRGSTVTVYANGTRLGVATLTDRLYEGQFAFFSFADGGIISCNFHNAWVMELNR